jgi:ankyrin repeat protein
VKSNDLVSLGAFAGNPHMVDKGGYNALMVAAKCRAADALKWAIENGVGRAGVDKEERKEGLTALMLACLRWTLTSLPPCVGKALGAQESIDCAWVLVRAGANPLKQDLSGRTCLHHAILSGLTEIAGFLCDTQFGPELARTADKEGLLPLKVASMRIAELKETEAKTEAEAKAKANADATAKTKAEAEAEAKAKANADATAKTHAASPRYCTDGGSGAAGPVDAADSVSTMTGVVEDGGGGDGGGGVLTPMELFVRDKLLPALARPDKAPALGTEKVAVNLKCFGCVVRAQEPKIKLKKKDVGGDVVVEVPIGDYLASAARRGDQVTLTRFAGYLDHVDSDGRNVIMSACVNRQLEIVQWAIGQFKAVSDAKLKTMICQPDDYGCTPAHFAAAGGRLDTQPDPGCMEEVLQAGGDINATDNAGFTPLHIAAQNGYPKIVKALLMRPDCDLDVYVDGQDALRLTTDDLVKQLLITAKELDGQFALVLRNDVVGLKKGPASAMTKHPRVRVTCVAFAVMMGRPKALVELLAFMSGADLGERGTSNYTLLMHACDTCGDVFADDAPDVKLECLRLLLAKSPPASVVNAVCRNDVKETALHKASRNGYPELVRALLNYPGTSRSLRDGNGRTALEVAANDEVRAVFEGSPALSTRPKKSKTKGGGGGGGGGAAGPGVVFGELTPLEVLKGDNDALRRDLEEVKGRLFAQGLLLRMQRGLIQESATQAIRAREGRVRAARWWSRLCARASLGGPGAEGFVPIPGWTYVVNAVRPGGQRRCREADHVCDASTTFDVTIVDPKAMFEGPEGEGVAARAMVAHLAAGVDRLDFAAGDLLEHTLQFDRMGDEAPRGGCGILDLLERIHGSGDNTSVEATIVLPVKAFVASESQCPSLGVVLDPLADPLPLLADEEEVAKVAREELRQTQYKFLGIMYPRFALSLADYVEREAVSEWEWGGIAMQVAHAMRVLAAKGVVHGDPGLHNWAMVVVHDLVARSNWGHRVVLTGFGPKSRAVEVQAPLSARPESETRPEPEPVSQVSCRTRGQTWAFVLGNSQYAGDMGPPFSGADDAARDVAAALQARGVHVCAHTNLTRVGLEAAWAAFVGALIPEDCVVVFYSGATPGGASGVIACVSGDDAGTGEAGVEVVVSPADAQVTLLSMLVGLPTGCRVAVLLDVHRPGMPGMPSVSSLLGGGADGVLDLVIAHAMPVRGRNAGGGPATAAGEGAPHRPGQSSFTRHLLTVLSVSQPLMTVEDALSAVKAGLVADGQRMSHHNHGDADQIVLGSWFPWGSGFEEDGGGAGAGAVAGASDGEGESPVAPPAPHWLTQAPSGCPCPQPLALESDWYTVGLALGSAMGRGNLAAFAALSPHALGLAAIFRVTHLHCPEVVWRLLGALMFAPPTVLWMSEAEVHWWVAAQRREMETSRFSGLDSVAYDQLDLYLASGTVATDARLLSMLKLEFLTWGQAPPEIPLADLALVDVTATRDFARGACGTVALATEARTGKTVCVKLSHVFHTPEAFGVRPGDCVHAIETAKVAVEATLQSWFRMERSLVRLVGIVRCASGPAIVTEYGGETLAQLCANQLSVVGGLDTKARLEALGAIARWILCGLHALHTHDPVVVHGDVKADNIFVKWEDGAVSGAQLGDFSSAQALFPAFQEASFGIVQPLEGPLDLKPPEVMTEEGALRAGPILPTPAMDMYSFGMTVARAVWLVAGGASLNGDLVETACTVLELEPAVRDSAGLVAVIRGCCALSPSERWDAVRASRMLLAL